MGIIETLSSGFDIVRKKPYLLIIPVLLDLVLLFGPRISILPVAEQSRELLVESLEATSDVFAIEDMDMALMQYDTAIETLGEFNVLSLLPVSSVVIPSVTAAMPIDLETDNVLYLSSLSQALLAATATLAIGLFIGCIYWGLVAEDVRGQQSGPATAIKAAPEYWIRMIKFALLIIVFVICAAGLLFLASTLAVILIMAGLAPLASIILMLAELFAFFAAISAAVYLFFVPQAVTLIRASTREAIKASIMVVRLAFWPSLGIILVTALVRAGMSILWGMLATSTLGTIGAIVGNAFIGTGLIVATFVFFRNQIIIIQQRIAEGSMMHNA